MNSFVMFFFYLKKERIQFRREYKVCWSIVDEKCEKKNRLKFYICLLDCP